MTVDVKKLEHALPVHAYGKDKAKSFRQLLNEIATGETQIIWQENRPIRLLSIVVVKVHCRDKTLVEDRQVFPDGRVRYRGIEGLSEKLHPQEEHSKGVYRALQEELGFSADELQGISIQFLGREWEKKESLSYPGLESHYDTYTYEVHIPDTLYKPEYTELCEEGMHSYFTWK
ncbi:MAG: hypothetical protein DCC43_00260 [Candidatus Brocadia sp.]|nr:hypothetical protein [Candidatus Brocadia fulgida]MCC6324884.1 hypothetical protein [Candidatus Brocadia sp.]MCE7910160.1 hypothetical protein [Candidatus Brocadia sp. AMX3]MDG5996163.1 hypothetical protein [Candidatus Brocadia sp.]RIK03462.1 MAG: hypothetical protein DCC43_00260 [Candidatus Brocadia sp.]